MFWTLSSISNGGTVHKFRGPVMDDDDVDIKRAFQWRRRWQSCLLCSFCLWCLPASFCDVVGCSSHCLFSFLGHCVTVVIGEISYMYHNHFGAILQFT